MSALPELPPLPERATPTWTDYGRECWQAGRRAGLEEAAKLCETMNHGAFGPETFLRGVETGSLGCAKAVRELAAKVHVNA